MMSNRLSRWMNRFPTDFIAAHPHLWHWYGFVLMPTSEWQAAEKPLQIAIEHYALSIT